MEKEWFDELTNAQKAKLKAMDGNVTFDQLIAFCKEENLPLPDDALEGVAGGDSYEELVDKYENESPCIDCPEHVFLSQR